MIDLFDSNLRRLTGYQLRRATSASTHGVNKVLSRFELRRSTYSSLSVIINQPGLNQRQLAHTLAIERPNLVKIIDVLERKQLVKRKLSNADRRAYALHPTTKGCELYQQATDAMITEDATLTRGMSDKEKIMLARLLQLIENNATQHKAK